MHGHQREQYRAGNRNELGRARDRISVVGFQFRSSFAGPWQTIVSVNNALQQLTIDTPYGLPTRTGGFQIQAGYATLGANIKYLLWAVISSKDGRSKSMYRSALSNSWDVWRISLGWTTFFATRAPTPDGQYQIEMWPTPFQAQVFPFEAYIQPPIWYSIRLSDHRYIRADLLVTRAVADAKVFSGRGSKYYDPTVAAGKMNEFTIESSKTWKIPTTCLTSKMSLGTMALKMAESDSDPAVLRPDVTTRFR